MPPNTPPNNLATPSTSPSPKAPIPGAEHLDPDEHVVVVLHRHIVGLIIIYLQAFAAVAALLALSYLTFPTLFGDLSGASNAVLAFFITLALGLLFFVLFIATYIYRQSLMVVTNKNIIQVLQRGLFLRKVSRLAISDVEDVSAEHKGILSSLFNFGILTIETAGEMRNFVFPYCPDPNKYANLILDARQRHAKAPE